MQKVLKLAVKAGVPLIHARYADVPNFQRLLAHVTKSCVVRISAPGSKRLDREAGSAKTSTYWTSEQIDGPDVLAAKLTEQACTMVALNQQCVTQDYLNVGAVPTPPRFLRGCLVDLGLDAKQVDEVLPALGGLTPSQAANLIRLCQASTGSLRPSDLLTCRRRFFSAARGLQVVDCTMPYYFPSPEVEDYGEWTKVFLLGDYDRRLRPRGVLLTGMPGTGKTTAAKRLAAVIGVQLFRLDLGAVKGKWVGESEHAMEDALMQVRTEAPCVLLVDEVEKLFSSTNDEGTTSSLLANLLWFLAEHDEPVVTVMTTNDHKALPPELVREGRLDRVIEMGTLSQADAETFGMELAKTFGVWSTKTNDAIYDAIVELGSNRDPITHATVEGVVKNVVRGVLGGRRG